MLLAMTILPAMDGLAKWLSGSLPVLEIVWARFLFYAFAVTSVAIGRRGMATFRSASPMLQLLRAGLMAISAWAYFSAVARMGMADAMAVFFIYPFVVLLITARLGAEPIDWRLWLIAAIGFSGSLLATRPTLQGLQHGAPYALCSGIAYALSMVLTRHLASMDSALLTSTISATVGLVAFSALVPPVWAAPSTAQWGALAIMGAFAATGHFLIVAAHKFTSASRLAPLGYAEIATTALIGRLAFGSVPSAQVVAGLALIIGSGVAATAIGHQRKVEL